MRDTAFFTPLALMSLRFTVPFYEEMGLFVRDPELFLMLVRRACKDDPETFRDWGAIRESFTTLLRYVEQELDEDSAKWFNVWLEDVVFQDTLCQNSWQIYDWLWGDCLYRAAIGEPNPIASVGEHRRLLRLYRMMCRLDDRLVRRLGSTDLETWDANILEYNDWSLVEDGPNGSLPVVGNTIDEFVQINRFQIYWHFVRRLLSDDDMNTIWSAAVAMQQVAAATSPLRVSKPTLPIPISQLARRLPL